MVTPTDAAESKSNSYLISYLDLSSSTDARAMRGLVPAPTRTARRRPDLKWRCTVRVEHLNSAAASAMVRCSGSSWDLLWANAAETAAVTSAAISDRSSALVRVQAGFSLASTYALTPTRSAAAVGWLS